jgi:predicted anti-sigma-YlaC factor YlaD
VESEIESHLENCDDCRMVQEAASTTLDHYFGTGRPAPKRIQLRDAIQAA